MQPQISIKRFIKPALAILLLVIVLLVLDNYLLKGSLAVSSAPGATISVGNPTDSKFKKIGTHKASVRLRPGEYIIRTQQGDSLTQTSIKVLARHSTSLNLSLSAAKTSQVAAADVTATKIKTLPDGSVLFLAASFHQLFQYSNKTQNNTPYLPDIYPVTQIDWLNNGGAIVSTGTSFSRYIDPSGKNNDSGVNLSLQNSNYSVSSTGQVAYISSDNKPTYLSSPLATPSVLPVSLAGGGHSVQLSPDGRYIFAYAGFNEADSSTKNPFTNYVIDALSPTAPIKFITDTGVDSAIWAPDNKLLVYSLGSHIVVRDAASGAEKQILTSVNPLPAWLLGFIDSSHLLYGQDAVIWELDTTSLISYKLSSYQGSISPSSFFIGPSRVLYYSTQADTSGHGGNIYKVTL